MRILIAARTFSPVVGGMERFAEMLADWLVTSGHEVTIVTRSVAPVGFDRRFSYPVVRSPGLLNLSRELRRADIVHANGVALRAITPARGLGRPLVVTHHGHQAVCPTGLAMPGDGSACDRGPRPGPCAACPGSGGRGKLAVAAHRAGARTAARNVPVSRYLHRRLGLPRSTPLYNPLPHFPTEVPSAADEEPGLLAFAGRMVFEKGLDRIIRALPMLPAFRLEAAGVGPMMAAWIRLAEEVGVAGRVRFLGRLSSYGVQGLYARASLVCVPSICPEAFGYAAAEAMALGRPTVASPLGALPEFLSDGRGFLAASSQPRDLAEAIREASEAPDRPAYGSDARNFARKHFLVDVIGSRYLETYAEALS